MTRSTILRGLVLGGSLALAAGLLPAPAQAMQPYDECLAGTEGIQTWGCYDLQLAPGGGVNAPVQLTWKLNTSAENYDNSNWRGGFVLTRWPVEGQWKKYPPLKATYLPGRHENCVDERINATNCYGTFAGSSGSLTVEFGPSMAGYVYEMYSHDYLCAADGVTCGSSGGAVDRYVFVLKAFQYKNKSGKVVKTQSCPSAKKRSSKCVPAAIAVLADNIGGGEPVPLPS